MRDKHEPHPVAEHRPAADLLARLALPTHAATYEPKRPQLRILAVAGRIVRTVHSVRHLLTIDAAWPRADVVIARMPRFCALPVP